MDDRAEKRKVDQLLQVRASFSRGGMEPEADTRGPTEEEGEGGTPSLPGG